MCIANTIFPHKEIHKVTWNSPDVRDRNKKDHFLVYNRYRSSIQDVRAFRGTDVGSDHCLCTAVVKMKLYGATSPKISTIIKLKRLNGACVKEKCRRNGVIGSVHCSFLRRRHWKKDCGMKKMQ